MPIALPGFRRRRRGSDVEAGARGQPESSRRTCAAPVCSRRSTRPPIWRRSPIPTSRRKYPDWRVINAQALVTGRLARGDGGRLKAEVRLWDVFAGKHLWGQQYSATPDNWRRIAHIISDAIYERLTGEKGYFDTPRRIHRRDRAEGPARQASRHHGSGRRRRALSHARRGLWCSLRGSRPRRKRSRTCPTGRVTRGCSCSISRPGSARWSAIFLA